MILQPDLFHISDIKKPSGKLGRFADIAYDYILKNEKPRDEIYKIASLEADYYSANFSDKRLNTALESCEPYWEKRLANKDVVTKTVPIYLSEGMSCKFEYCINGIATNVKFKNLLNPQGFLMDPESFNEYAFFCEAIVHCEIDGEFVQVPIKLKGKFDNFTIDEEESIVTLNDLKTSGKPVSWFMGCNATFFDEGLNPYTKWIDGSFQKFHYHRQMAMYSWLLQTYILTKYNTPFTFKANMLVVETVPEFQAKVCSVSNGNIKKGLDELKKLLIMVAKLQWEKQK